VRPNDGWRRFRCKFHNASQIDGGSPVDVQLGAADDVGDGLCKTKKYKKKAQDEQSTG